ncbi:hypothetical protein C5167_008563 [Papaver somniferum]|uniref:Uncharacterized protein n=1 Tax=Papaver somniferum TaxID=3469 RepID=A0A4Y7JVZ5_PAPSO|nr:hypothetical protein C5167_008563 [Papaver somniferum]
MGTIATEFAIQGFNDSGTSGELLQEYKDHTCKDVSDVRQVPDHPEAYVDSARDESVIIELLDLKHDVGDNGSDVWFLQDLATEQNAEGTTVIEQSGVFTANGIRYRIYCETLFIFKSNLATLDEKSVVVTSSRADKHFEEDIPILCAALDKLKLSTFPEFEVDPAVKEAFFLVHAEHGPDN